MGALSIFPIGSEEIPMSRDNIRNIFAICLTLVTSLEITQPTTRATDWPTVRGNGQRTGFTPDCVRPPFRLDWTVEFPNEVICTRVEAIVADGLVYVGTLHGTVWAIDRRTGATVWRRPGLGPIMHSPSWAQGRLYVGDTDGAVTALDAKTGEIQWHFASRRGGFVTSPLIFEGTVYAGSRDGCFYAVDATTGALRWQFATGGPIRCTAAATDKWIFFASDDMYAYALEADTGKLIWKSEKLYGQSFRDYYPVILGDSVLLRSVLVEEMNEELNGGTAFLQRRAGIPGNWRELEAFFRSEASLGTAEDIRNEQAAIKQRLIENPYRRTFFVLDRVTGKVTLIPPILYIAGNQGCGIPPVATADGRPIVFYRTVYSNWNLGVKPAVGLGLLDLQEGWITPLRHRQGNVPPWNTFWGTSDETTNFSVGGSLLYICHQGTLSFLDLETRDLRPIHGERDTWGGKLAPPWVANEWHGPARGSCAISGDQLFWVTGSRLLCIRGNLTDAAQVNRDQPPRPTSPSPTAAMSQPVPPEVTTADVRQLIAERPGPERRSDACVDGLRAELVQQVVELLDGHPWAPFYLQMGIGSRDFYFAHPSYMVQALALAWPHLPADLGERVRQRIQEELPGSLRPDALPLDQGRRRELFEVPPHDLSWSYHPRWPTASHLYAVWLYADRTGDWQTVEQHWPTIRQAAYAGTAIAWDAEQRGHLYMNRIASGYLAFARIAERYGSQQDHDFAEQQLRLWLSRILEAWCDKARIAREELSRPEQRGDTSGNPARKLYIHLNNHKSKLAICMDMTPELGRFLAEKVPEAVAIVEKAIDTFMPTFYLAFEERPVHYGENFVELPDTVHGIFLCKTFLWRRHSRLAGYLDIPWVKADLFYIEKLVYVIENSAETNR